MPFPGSIATDMANAIPDGTLSQYAVNAAVARILTQMFAFGMFDNPASGKTDNLMEGLYVRTEAAGYVTGRAKIVRSEFVEKVKQSEHWQHQKMVPNELAEDVDIWS